MSHLVRPAAPESLWLPPGSAPACGAEERLPPVLGLYEDVEADVAAVEEAKGEAVAKLDRAMPNGKVRWPAQSRCSEVLPRVSARHAEADAKMALETLDRLLAVERKATADYGPHPRMQDAERLRREAEEGHERAVRAADAAVQESLSLAHEAAVEALSGTPSTRTRAAAHRQYMTAFDRARIPWTRATQGTKEANEAMKEVRRLVLEAATVLSRVKVAPADAGALPRRRTKTGLNALV
jgi:hypothetical protein